LKVAHPLATQQFSTDGIDLFVEHYGALIQASQAERHQLELAIHTHIQRIEADDQGLALNYIPSIVLMRKIIPALSSSIPALPLVA
jgi:hypothetical protein